jgi:hypothetical protein
VRPSIPTTIGYDVPYRSLASFALKYMIRLKGRVVPVPKHHAMKAYKGREDTAHLLLASTLVLGDLSASRPGHFASEEGALGIHYQGVWVIPRACLDTVVVKFPPPPAAIQPLPSSL